MFFISGITGKVGGAAARQLLKEGRQVRALVRDPQKATEWSRQGVDVRQGSLDDAAAVASALKGVEGAFLMMPPTLPTPGYPEAKATIAAYSEALRLSAPPRLIVLSSFGSQQTRGLGNITSTHLLESALEDAPFPVAFVRPGSFIDNYLYGLDQAEATGAFDILLGPTNRAIPMTASVDIGREVVRLLTGEWTGRKVVELGTRYSPEDLAVAMGRVLGRTVEVRSTPREQWPVALGYMGVPEVSVGLYVEMMDSLNSGWIDFGVPGAESVAGTTSPEEFFTQARKP